MAALSFGQEIIVDEFQIKSSFRIETAIPFSIRFDFSLGANSQHLKSFIDSFTKHAITKYWNTAYLF
jgi:hypothetical protein